VGGGLGRLECGLRLEKRWVSIMVGVGWGSIGVVGGEGKQKGNKK
jgi:hypothetical protein